MSATGKIGGRWSLPVLIILIFPFAAFFARALADVLVVSIGLAFLYRSHKIQDWTWARKPWFMLALVLWAYLILLVSPFAEDRLQSLFHSVAFMRWPLFAAALAYWILADVPVRRKFEWTLAALAVFVIADSVYQYFVGVDIFGRPSQDVRLTGPFKKLVPGTFTLRIFFIALVAVYFGLEFRSDRFRVASILGLLALGAGFEFLTGERAAFAMFLFGSLIVFVGLWVVHSDQRWFMAGTGAALVLLLGMAVSTQPKMVDRTINSLVAGAMAYADQPGGRILTSALTIWADHPALGIGIKGFETTCPEYSERGDAPECNVHPHNIYVQWLVETGAIGLGLFVALVASLFIAVWRNAKGGDGPMLPLFATVVMLTSLWPLMGSMSFFNNWIAAVIWMGIGWALAATNGRPAPNANACSP